jgi:hypothetical protein
MKKKNKKNGRSAPGGAMKRPGCLTGRTMRFTVLLLTIVTLASCGPKKKGPMHIATTDDKTEMYKAGFGEYFSPVSVSASPKSVRYMVITNSVVFIGEPVNGGFLIRVNDRGIIVYVTFLYIVRTKMGYKEVKHKLTIIHKETDNPAERIAATAAKIYNNLEEIEKKLKSGEM